MQKSLSGVNIEFVGNRIINVGEEIIPRGSTCRCYFCVVKDSCGNEEKKLLKEFAPKEFELFLTEDGFTRTISSEKVFFEKRFIDYFDRMSKVRSILLKTINTDNTLKRYIFVPPDSVLNQKCIDSITVFNSEDSKYCYLQLFDYDDTAFSNKINSLSIKERLEALINLSKIINEFHKNNLLIADIKPDNFVFDSDGIGNSLKLFDFDSVLDLNKPLEAKNITCSQPWAPFELQSKLISKISLTSDLYSLGVMLLYFVMYDCFDDDKEYKLEQALMWNFNLNKEINAAYDPFIIENYKRANEKDKFITIGFWNKLKDIFYTTTNKRNPQKRYYEKFNLPVEYFIEQLNILLEIYENIGVHPEVMLNNAIKDVQNNEQYSQENFDPDLFTEIEVVND